MSGPEPICDVDAFHRRAETAPERSLRVVGVEDFVQAPVGRCVVGDGWVHWCADPTLFGISMWGTPSRGAIRSLVDSIVMAATRGSLRAAAFVDATRVVSLAPGALAAFDAFVRGDARLIVARARCLAVATGRSTAATLATGFFSVCTPPIPVSLFVEPIDGLAWCGSPPSAAARLLDELASLHVGAAGTPRLLSELRLALSQARYRLDGEAVARVLGLSFRTMQRRLRHHRTSFQDELRRARVEDAKQRLLASEVSITELAFDLGFSSSQHFSTEFRRLCGERPTDWRGRHRSYPLDGSGDPAPLVGPRST